MADFYDRLEIAERQVGGRIIAGCVDTHVLAINAIAFCKECEMYEGDYKRGNECKVKCNDAIPLLNTTVLDTLLKSHQ